MTLSEHEIAQFVGQYFWPFCRIGAFFMAVPVLGSQLITTRVRVLLGWMLTLIVVPLLPPLPAVPPLSLQSFSIVLQQILIGVAMGFVLQVVFQLFVLAGQFIAMKMGLGFAQMNDPINGVGVTVISQLYLMMATLLFLVVNGHLVVIEYLVDSFQTLPVSDSGLEIRHLWMIASMGSWMFGSALAVALPVLTSLLVVNLAFGVMSRAAPQMNVFAVGFPITLVFGLLLVWFGLSSYLTNYDLFMRYGLDLVRQVTGSAP